MRQQIIAKRYARALFALGQEEGIEAQKRYGQELVELAELFEQVPQLISIFKNPIIRVEHKKEIIRQILEKAKSSQIVRNFCFYLADKGRLEFFIEIQHYYGRLLDQAEGLVRGKVVTAIDLGKSKRDQIHQQLESQSAQNLILDYETDESILGGLVLKVGDKIYDASLQAQLALMKENIKRGE